jgi:hypothetical protein
MGRGVGSWKAFLRLNALNALKDLGDLWKTWMGLLLGVWPLQGRDVLWVSFR